MERAGRRLSTISDAVPWYMDSTITAGASSPRVRQSFGFSHTESSGRSAISVSQACAVIIMPSPRPSIAHTA